MDYDVVIVGAGPAGLNCAKHLAGKQVLLIERNAVIGPKVCAGGITPEDLEYLQLPKSTLEKSFSHILIHTSVSKPIKDDYPVSTVSREELGQWMLRGLGKNVTVRMNAKVTSIGKDFVIVNGEKIRFRYLVGADGSSSLVRRHLKIPSRDVGIAFQYIVRGEWKDLEIFFDAKSFGSWYAWIFPYKGCASIGCGCDPKIFPPSKLRKSFHKWMDSRGIDYSKGRFESHPINFDFRGWKFGNTFLAGDAAGFASGITGEGIYQALISGEEVAKTILNPKHKPARLEKLIAVKKEEKTLVNKLNAILKKHGPVPEIEERLMQFFSEQD